MYKQVHLKNTETTRIKDGGHVGSLVDWGREVLVLVIREWLLVLVDRKGYGFWLTEDGLSCRLVGKFGKSISSTCWIGECLTPPPPTAF